MFRKTNHPFIIGVLALVLALASCSTAGRDHPLRASEPEPEVRFLLTFDDGPLPGPAGSTAAVLDRLRNNSVQPGVKAIFFVQTRAPKNGDPEEIRRMMDREQNAGHVLALHSGSARGHVNHTSMPSSELQQSLEDGKSDISSVSGNAPLFVRPTFWRYNHETLARYENNGLHMLLSDVKAYDGGRGSLPLNSALSSQRHGNMLAELQRVHRRVVRHDIPVVNGVVPILVTFHDTNAFTARHLEEYLKILVQEARHAGLRVSDKPFYDDRREVETAALARTEHRVILETRLPARISRFFKGS